jgi:predicted glycosyltransferase
MGLGHLRRISRLAGALRERFSTLVLSGLREAAWIVPPGCGLVKLPDWDGISRERSRRAGVTPWIDLSGDEANAFRAGAIREMAALYCPDAIVVDYLPFGQRRELESLLASRDTLRYFLHRGLSDTSDSAILRGDATREIAARYDRILVAADPRLVDVAEEDGYCDEARARLSYVGFIAPEAAPRGAEWTPAVVCSGGGGYLAEETMRACLDIAARHPRIPFRIVLGPRSRLSAAELSPPANCELHQRRDDLPELHASAAVVVSSGGYNSVLESALGGARLIVHPSQSGDDDEQIRFAERLSAHHPVSRLDRLDGLEDAILREWAAALEGPATPLALRTGGGERIGEILAEDLAAR